MISRISVVCRLLCSAMQILLRAKVLTGSMRKPIRLQRHHVDHHVLHHHWVRSVIWCAYSSHHSSRKEIQKEAQAGGRSFEKSNSYAHKVRYKLCSILIPR